MSKQISKRPCAVGYIRVSTTGQADTGVSLDAQRSAIENWCGDHGYDLLDIEQDAGLSGTKFKSRPGIQRALRTIELTGATLVAYSLSRVARSVKNAVHIVDEIGKAGGNLVSLTEQWDTTTASGKMIFGLMAVLAQFERDMISERTRSALAYKKSKGEVTGELPYGYRRVPGSTPARLEPDPDEQKTLGLILKWRKDGLVLAEIARKLTRLKRYTGRGTPWSAPRICQVLKRIETEQTG